MSIKQVSPIKRTKGFKSENIDIKDLNNFGTDHEKVKKKIKILFPSLNLSVEDKNILNKIISEKNIALNGHEKVEFKKIKEKDWHRYLIYRYKYNNYPKEYYVGKYPPCVQIEPTSVCNYRCVMCYQADKTFSAKSKGYMGNMDIDIFKKIIDELEGNVEAITFASRGEPTLNKDFTKMLKYCENKFLGLKMNTNASLLNEKMIHEILSSDLQTIVFSIDAKDKESYEKIRINGKFDKIIKNLELFNEIREKNYNRNDKIVRISGVKINKKQNILEMKKQWGNIADIVAFTNYIPWESSYDNAINEIEDPCKELWLRMFIWYDGKVNPCDFDYKSKLAKYNIKNESVKNIWNSEYYNNLRHHHLNKLRKKIEPCARCINS